MIESESICVAETTEHWNNLNPTPNVNNTKANKFVRNKKRHVCEVCDKVFLKKCGLTTHLLAHAGVKPFVCDICSKAFTKKCTLTVHLLTHSKEKPHICTICKKSFARKTDMLKHVLIHEDEKRYSCDNCKKQFTQPSNLRRHKVRHCYKDYYIQKQSKKETNKIFKQNEISVPRKIKDVSQHGRNISVALGNSDKIQNKIKQNLCYLKSVEAASNNFSSNNVIENTISCPIDDAEKQFKVCFVKGKQVHVMFVNTSFVISATKTDTSSIQSLKESFANVIKDSNTDNCNINPKQLPKSNANLLNSIFMKKISDFLTKQTKAQVPSGSFCMQADENVVGEMKLNSDEKNHDECLDSISKKNIQQCESTKNVTEEIKLSEKIITNNLQDKNYASIDNETLLVSNVCNDPNADVLNLLDYSKEFKKIISTPFQVNHCKSIPLRKENALDQIFKNVTLNSNFETESVSGQTKLLETELQSSTFKENPKLISEIDFSGFNGFHSMYPVYKIVGENEGSFSNKTRELVEASEIVDSKITKLLQFDMIEKKLHNAAMSLDDIPQFDNGQSQNRKQTRGDNLAINYCCLGETTEKSKMDQCEGLTEALEVMEACVKAGNLVGDQSILSENTINTDECCQILEQLRDEASKKSSKGLLDFPPICPDENFQSESVVLIPDQIQENNNEFSLNVPYNEEKASASANNITTRAIEHSMDSKDKGTAVKDSGIIEDTFCDICEQSFESIDQLETHLNNHTNNDHYGCCICDAVFRTKSLLQDHILTHDDIDMVDIDKLDLQEDLEANLPNLDCPGEVDLNGIDEMGDEDFDEKVARMYALAHIDLDSEEEYSDDEATRLYFLANVGESKMRSTKKDLSFSDIYKQMSDNMCTIRKSCVAQDEPSISDTSLTFVTEHKDDPLSLINVLPFSSSTAVNDKCAQPAISKVISSSSPIEASYNFIPPLISDTLCNSYRTTLNNNSTVPYTSDVLSSSSLTTFTDSCAPPLVSCEISSSSQVAVKYNSNPPHVSDLHCNSSRTTFSDSSTIPYVLDVFSSLYPTTFSGNFTLPTVSNVISSSSMIASNKKSMPPLVSDVLSSSLLTTLSGSSIIPDILDVFSSSSSIKVVDNFSQPLVSNVVTSLTSTKVSESAAQPPVTYGLSSSSQTEISDSLAQLVTSLSPTTFSESAAQSSVTYVPSSSTLTAVGENFGQLVTGLSPTKVIENSARPSVTYVFSSSSQTEISDNLAEPLVSNVVTSLSPAKSSESSAQPSVTYVLSSSSQTELSDNFERPLVSNVVTSLSPTEVSGSSAQPSVTYVLSNSPSTVVRDIFVQPYISATTEISGNSAQPSVTYVLSSPLPTEISENSAQVPVSNVLSKISTILSSDNSVQPHSTYILPSLSCIPAIENNSVSNVLCSLYTTESHDNPVPPPTVAVIPNSTAEAICNNLVPSSDVDILQKQKSEIESLSLESILLSPDISTSIQKLVGSESLTEAITQVEQYTGNETSKEFGQNVLKDKKEENAVTFSNFIISEIHSEKGNNESNINLVHSNNADDLYMKINICKNYNALYSISSQDTECSNSHEKENSLNYFRGYESNNEVHLNNIRQNNRKVISITSDIDALNVASNVEVDFMHSHSVGFQCHRCKICDKTFEKPKNLRSHYLTHAGIKPYMCSICKKTFTKKWSLKVHSIIHTGERKFSCDQCQKKFCRKLDLDKHGLVHSGIKPYHCQICEKRFTHQNNLTRHLWVHEPTKPCVCAICKVAVSNKVSLLSHMRSHILKGDNSALLQSFKDKLHTCDVCNLLFARKDRLLKHKSIHSTRHQT